MNTLIFVCLASRAIVIVKFEVACGSPLVDARDFQTGRHCKILNMCFPGFSFYSRLVYLRDGHFNLKLLSVDYKNRGINQIEQFPCYTSLYG